MKKSFNFKIGVWGQLGHNNIVADGQAVRTNTILELLKGEYGDGDIYVANTNNWKRRPITFLLKTIKLVRKSKNIIVLPADNGFKIITPLLNFLNKIYKRNVIYVIIGGFLPELLAKRPKYIKMLNKHRVLLSQTTEQIIELNKLGLSNVALFPNFKIFSETKKIELVKNNDKQIKLVFLSRITRDKGIIEAVEAVNIVNKKLEEKYISLDFYGIVASDFEEEFKNLLNENKGTITYKGIVNYDETHFVLSKYFSVLFPTYYYGEGQPGIFIDSYFSGVPVIATDWKYNNEFVVNKKNGFLVPIKDAKSIAEKITTLYEDRELHFKMQKATFELRKKYEPQVIIEILLTYIS